MKITAGVQFQSPEFATAGVQARMDAVVAHFSNSPRGFARAWCEALSPSVLHKDAWQDLDHVVTYDVPKEAVAKLAKADADLIAAELKKGGPASLAFELEAACVVGGLEHSAYLPANHRAETRVIEGRDAVTYYRGLDKGAGDWQRALADSKPISELVFREVGKHHARLTDKSPLHFDAKGITLIAGSRVAMEADAAVKKAELAALRVSPDDTARIIEVFTHGTRHTVHGLTDGHLKDIMASLATLIGTPRAHETGRFLQNVRDRFRSGGIGFSDKTVEMAFHRCEYEAPLREACARHGLDYNKYNGVYDDSWHS